MQLSFLLILVVAADAVPDAGKKLTPVAAHQATAPSLRSAAGAVAKAPVASVATKSSRAAVNTTKSSSAPPCQCVATDPSWVAPTRTNTKCIFIDLGAADGNTFGSFLNNGYGPIKDCTNGDYEAFLVEANPRFVPQLNSIAGQHPGKVTVMSNAAFMCEAETNFYLDTVNTKENYWGSSMDASHPDAQASGLQKVDVKTINVMRLLHEHTIPGDYVILKMDIEGAERDIIPCLAKAPDASLVDSFYLEDHYHLPSVVNRGDEPQYLAAKAELLRRHIEMPKYFSNTL